MESQERPMTRWKAKREAQRRWGRTAWADDINDVCLVGDAREVWGAGRTWEAAFASVDDPTSFRSRLLATFETLCTKHGFVARVHAACCGNCSGRAMREEAEREEQTLYGKAAEGRPYCFTHAQNEDEILEGTAHVGYGCVLYEDSGWDGSREDAEIAKAAEMLVSVARAHGLIAEWNGDIRTTVLLKDPRLGRSPSEVPTLEERRKGAV